MVVSMTSAIRARAAYCPSDAVARAATSALTMTAIATRAAANVIALESMKTARTVGPALSLGATRSR